MKLRLPAVVLISALVLQDLVWAQGSPSLSTLSPAASAPIAVPAEWGQLRGFHRGTDDSLVINIQDAHASLPAQKSIAAILESLFRNYDMRLVGLEGSSGVVDTRAVSSYPVPEARRAVAESLLADTKISGAEFFRIVSAESAELYGVEDDALYAQNIEAYKTLLTQSETARARLERLWSAALEKEKTAYSPEHLAFAVSFRRYRAGEIEPEAFWQAFESAARAAALDWAAHPGLAGWKDLKEAERRIDFKQAEIERSALLQVLHRRLDASARRRWFGQLSAFRAGKTSLAAFHSELLDRARALAIDLAAYPMLARYVDYAKGFEATDALALSQGIEAAGLEIERRLAEKDGSAEPSARARALEIVRKFFEASLTPSDDAFFREHPELFEMNDPVLAEGFARARGFYEAVRRRNEAMVNRLILRMKEKGVRVAALVSGGFHSEGLSGLMAARRVSHVIVMPKFETGGSSRPYVAVITDRGSYLDRALREEAVFESVALLFGVELLNGRKLEEILEKYLASLGPGDSVEDAVSSRAETRSADAPSFSSRVLPFSGDQAVMTRSIYAGDVSAARLVQFAEGIRLLKRMGSRLALWLPEPFQAAFDVTRAEKGKPAWIGRSALPDVEVAAILQLSPAVIQRPDASERAKIAELQPGGARLEAAQATRGARLSPRNSQLRKLMVKQQASGEFKPVRLLYIYHPVGKQLAFIHYSRKKDPKELRVLASNALGESVDPEIRQAGWMLVLQAVQREKPDYLYFGGDIRDAKLVNLLVRELRARRLPAMPGLSLSAQSFRTLRDLRRQLRRDKDGARMAARRPASPLDSPTMGLIAERMRPFEGRRAHASPASSLARAWDAYYDAAKSQSHSDPRKARSAGAEKSFLHSHPWLSAIVLSPVLLGVFAVFGALSLSTLLPAVFVSVLLLRFTVVEAVKARSVFGLWNGVKESARLTAHIFDFAIKFMRGWIRAYFLPVASYLGHRLIGDERAKRGFSEYLKGHLARRGFSASPEGRQTVSAASFVYRAFAIRASIDFIKDRAVLQILSMAAFNAVVSLTALPLLPLIFIAAVPAVLAAVFAVKNYRKMKHSEDPSARMRFFLTLGTSAALSALTAFMGYAFWQGMGFDLGAVGMPVHTDAFAFIPELNLDLTVGKLAPKGVTAFLMAVLATAKVLFSKGGRVPDFFRAFAGEFKKPEFWGRVALSLVFGASLEYEIHILQHAAHQSGNPLAVWTVNFFEGNQEEQQKNQALILAGREDEITLSSRFIAGGMLGVMDPLAHVDDALVALGKNTGRQIFGDEAADSWEEARERVRRDHRPPVNPFVASAQNLPPQTSSSQAPVPASGPQDFLGRQRLDFDRETEIIGDGFIYVRGLGERKLSAVVAEEAVSRQPADRVSEWVKRLDGTDPAKAGDRYDAILEAGRSGRADPKLLEALRDVVSHHGKSAKPPPGVPRMGIQAGPNLGSPLLHVITANLDEAVVYIHDSISSVLGFFNEEEGKNRSAAIWALGELRSGMSDREAKKTAETLERAMKNDPDPSVRIAAAAQSEKFTLSANVKNRDARYDTFGEAMDTGDRSLQFFTLATLAGSDRSRHDARIEPAIGRAIRETGADKEEHVFAAAVHAAAHHDFKNLLPGIVARLLDTKAPDNLDQAARQEFVLSSVSRAFSKSDASFKEAARLQLIRASRDAWPGRSGAVNEVLLPLIRDLSADEASYRRALAEILRRPAPESAPRPAGDGSIERDYAPERARAERALSDEAREFFTRHGSEADSLALLLTDRNVDVRFTAVDRLSAIGGLHAVRLLRFVAEQDSNERVQMAALRGLLRLNASDSLLYSSGQDPLLSLYERLAVREGRSPLFDRFLAEALAASRTADALSPMLSLYLRQRPSIEDTVDRVREKYAVRKPLEETIVSIASDPTAGAAARDILRDRLREGAGARTELLALARRVADEIPAGPAKAAFLEDLKFYEVSRREDAPARAAQPLTELQEWENAFFGPASFAADPAPERTVFESDDSRMRLSAAVLLADRVSASSILLRLAQHDANADIRAQALRSLRSQIERGWVRFGGAADPLFAELRQIAEDGTEDALVRALALDDLRRLSDAGSAESVKVLLGSKELRLVLVTAQALELLPPEDALGIAEAWLAVLVREPDYRSGDAAWVDPIRTVVVEKIKEIAGRPELRDRLAERLKLFRQRHLREPRILALLDEAGRRAGMDMAAMAGTQMLLSETDIAGADATQLELFLYNWSAEPALLERAARRMGELPASASSIDALGALLENQRSIGVQSAAIESLGRLGAARSLDPNNPAVVFLRGALAGDAASTDPRVRAAAVGSLIEIGGPFALGAAAQALQDSGENIVAVRQAAEKVTTLRPAGADVLAEPFLALFVRASGDDFPAQYDTGEVVRGEMAAALNAIAGQSLELKSRVLERIDDRLKNVEINATAKATSNGGSKLTPDAITYLQRLRSSIDRVRPVVSIPPPPDAGERRLADSARPAPVVPIREEGETRLRAVPAKVVSIALPVQPALFRPQQQGVFFQNVQDVRENPLLAQQNAAPPKPPVESAKPPALPAPKPIPISAGDPVRTLKFDENPERLVAAADAVGRSHSTLVIPDLVHRLDHGDWRVRVAAAKALGNYPFSVLASYGLGEATLQKIENKILDANTPAASSETPGLVAALGGFQGSSAPYRLMHVLDALDRYEQRFAKPEQAKQYKAIADAWLAAVEKHTETAAAPVIQAIRERLKQEAESAGGLASADWVLISAARKIDPGYKDFFKALAAEQPEAAGQLQRILLTRQQADEKEEEEKTLSFDGDLSYLKRRERDAMNSLLEENRAVAAQVGDMRAALAREHGIPEDDPLFPFALQEAIALELPQSAEDSTKLRVLARLLTHTLSPEEAVAGKWTDPFIPLLAELAKHPDFQIRADAAAALAVSKDAQAKEILRTFLADPNSFVLAQAIRVSARSPFSPDLFADLLKIPVQDRYKAMIGSWFDTGVVLETLDNALAEIVDRYKAAPGSARKLRDALNSAIAESDESAARYVYRPLLDRLDPEAAGKYWYLSIGWLVFQWTGLISLAASLYVVFRRWRARHANKNGLQAHSYDKSKIWIFGRFVDAYRAVVEGVRNGRSRPRPAAPIRESTDRLTDRKEEDPPTGARLAAEDEDPFTKSLLDFDKRLWQAEKSNDPPEPALLNEWLRRAQGLFLQLQFPEKPPRRMRSFIDESSAQEVWVALDHVHSLFVRWYRREPGEEVQNPDGKRRFFLREDALVEGRREVFLMRDYFLEYQLVANQLKHLLMYHGYREVRRSQVQWQHALPMLRDFSISRLETHIARMLALGDILIDKDDPAVKEAAGVDDLAATEAYRAKARRVRQLYIAAILKQEAGSETDDAKAGEEADAEKPELTEFFKRNAGGFAKLETLDAVMNQQTQRRKDTRYAPWVIAVLETVLWAYLAAKNKLGFWTFVTSVTPKLLGIAVTTAIAWVRMSLGFYDHDSGYLHLVHDRKRDEQEFLKETGFPMVGVDYWGGILRRRIIRMGQDNVRAQKEGVLDALIVVTPPGQMDRIEEELRGSSMTNGVTVLLVSNVNGLRGEPRRGSFHSKLRAYSLVSPESTLDGTPLDATLGRIIETAKEDERTRVIYEPDKIEHRRVPNIGIVYVPTGEAHAPEMHRELGFPIDGMALAGESRTTLFTLSILQHLRGALVARSEGRRYFGESRADRFYLEDIYPLENPNTTRIHFAYTDSSRAGSTATAVLGDQSPERLIRAGVSLEYVRKKLNLAEQPYLNVAPGTPGDRFVSQTGYMEGFLHPTTVAVLRTLQGLINAFERDYPEFSTILDVMNEELRIRAAELVLIPLLLLSNEKSTQNLSAYISQIEQDVVKAVKRRIQDMPGALGFQRRVLMDRDVEGVRRDLLAEPRTITAIIEAFFADYSDFLEGMTDRGDARIVPEFSSVFPRRSNLFWDGFPQPLFSALGVVPEQIMTSKAARSGARFAAPAVEEAAPGVALPERSLTLKLLVPDFSKSDLSAVGSFIEDARAAARILVPHDRVEIALVLPARERDLVPSVKQVLRSRLGTLQGLRVAVGEPKEFSSGSDTITLDGLFQKEADAALRRTVLYREVRKYSRETADAYAGRLERAMENLSERDKIRVLSRHLGRLGPYTLAAVRVLHEQNASLGEAFAAPQALVRAALESPKTVAVGDSLVLDSGDPEAMLRSMEAQLEMLREQTGAKTDPVRLFWKTSKARRADLEKWTRQTGIGAGWKIVEADGPLSSDEIHELAREAGVISGEVSPKDFAVAGTLGDRDRLSAAGSESPVLLVEPDAGGQMGFWVPRLLDIFGSDPPPSVFFENGFFIYRAVPFDLDRLLSLAQGARLALESSA